MPQRSWIPCVAIVSALLIPTARGYLPPAKSEVGQWWQKAEDLMTPRKQYTDAKQFPQMLRRTFATPLLLSVWQNRGSLEPGEQAKAALRHSQALIAGNDLPAAWRVLDTALKAPGLFPCSAKPDVLTQYLCAERDRLAGDAAYGLHSYPGGRLDPVEAPICSGLGNPLPASVAPRCLSLALEALRRALITFPALISTVKGASITPELDALMATLGVRSVSALEARLVQRERATRLNLALTLQESGDPTAMLAELAKLANKATDCSAPVSAGAVVDEVEALLCLHTARGLRDIAKTPADLEPARRALVLPQSLGSRSPENAWLGHIVASTLEIRNGHPDTAAKLIQDSLRFREADQRTKLELGNPLDLERPLAGSENSDDIFISAALRYADRPNWQRLLQRYVGFAIGAGDWFLRAQFRHWHAPGKQGIFDRIAASVNSDTSHWVNGDLADSRRREAFEELEKSVADLHDSVKAEHRTGAEMWDEAWQKIGATGELLVILQHRPFDIFHSVAKAVAPHQYTALHFQAPNKAPVIRHLGSSAEWDARIRLLRSHVETEQQQSGLVQELSQKLSLTDLAGAAVRADGTRRLVVLAGGEFQQFPWMILNDAYGKPLMDHRTVVQVGSLAEVASWGATLKPASSSVMVSTPELQALRPLVQKGTLSRLLSLLQWQPGHLLDAEREWKQFARSSPGAVRRFGAQASESYAHMVTNPWLLHIRTHGLFLGGQTQVPASDRSVLTLTPDSKNDGLFLATEAKMMRLDNTRLVTLAVCQSGQGRVQRSEPVEGFRRAFHIAGARSVVAPLWIVDSAETADVMERLYAQSGVDLDIALRSAQVALRRKNPRHWAGWILSGDPTAVQVPSSFSVH